MHKPVIFMAACLAAACSQGPATDAGEGESATEAMTTANGSPPGTYYMAAADGSASLVTIYADGTYSQVTPDGAYPARGTFEVVDDKTCFRVQKIGAEPNCYTESERAEDGSFVATLDSGDQIAVTPYTAEDVDVSD